MKQFDEGAVMVAKGCRNDDGQPGEWIKFHDAGVEVSVASSPELTSDTIIYIRKLT